MLTIAVQHQSQRGGRVGFGPYVDPDLAAAVKLEAANRGTYHWWVVQEALRRGLPTVPQADEPGLPRGAYQAHRNRRRARAMLFAYIDPTIIADIRRHAAGQLHHWWVAEEALRRGLPLLPVTEQEVLPQSA